MINECCRCKSFSAYYSKGYVKFIRTDCGECKKLGKTVNKHFTCEKFKCKSNNRTEKRAAVMRALGDVVTNIDAIKLILEEDKNF